MALNRSQVQTLINHRFLPSEIEELNNAVTPDGKPMDLDAVFYSQPFQDALKSRLTWWNNCRKPIEQDGLGWSYSRTIQELRAYYDIRKGRKSRSVWDFIKLEYRPTEKVLSQSQFEQAVSAKIKIGHQFHRTYKTDKIKRSRIYREL